MSPFINVSGRISCDIGYCRRRVCGLRCGVHFTLRTSRRMAYIGPILTELQISSHTMAILTLKASPS